MWTRCQVREMIVATLSIDEYVEFSPGFTLLGFFAAAPPPPPPVVVVVVSSAAAEPTTIGSSFPTPSSFSFFILSNITYR
ncbi:hypothetical protein MIMGU_mgv1a0146782mg, partial [Erythranthe guttata]